MIGIKRRTLSHSEKGLIVNKQEIEILDTIFNNLINKHTYYKSNKYYFIITDNESSKLKKKKIKKIIETSINSNWVEDVDMRRITDDKLEVMIESGYVQKVPVIEYIATVDGTIAKLYNNVLESIFEDAVHDVIAVYADHILIRNTLTMENIVINFAGFRYDICGNETLIIF